MQVRVSLTYLGFPVSYINFLDMLVSLVTRSIGDSVAKKFAVHRVEARRLPGYEYGRCGGVVSRGDCRLANWN